MIFDYSKPFVFSTDSDSEAASFVRVIHSFPSKRDLTLIAQRFTDEGRLLL